MKKLLLCLIFQGCLLAMAQYPITSVNIIMPTSPSANPADWASAMPPVMITAQAQVRNGRVPGEVQESRILVTIKQGGSKKYGSYTQDNAPIAGFNSVVKNWSGGSVTDLLGKVTTLPAGSYELCVQFFTNNTPAKPLSNEVCKNFTIADTKSDSYNPPVNISPVDKKVFDEKEIKTPITFRWTPLTPRPKEPVVYKLRVWQLMQGQTGMQAMKSNQPVIENEVRDMNQMIVNGLYTGPCKPPYLCEFIWNVEAVDRQGKVLGASEPTGFKIIIDDPSVGCFKLDTTQYRIVCNGFDEFGKPKYTLSNLILTNIGSNIGRTGLHNTPATNYITPSGFTVSGLTPASATSIAPSTSINIGFDIIGASGTTATFIVNSTIISPTNPNLYCDKTIGVTVDLPLCYCKDCDKAQLSLNNPSVNLTNASTGLYTATGSLIISGLPAVYGIEMQVQNYTYTATPTACSNGVTSIENSGVFNLSGTTINGSPVSMLNETVSSLSSTNNGVAKNIKLLSTTPLPGVIPLNLIFGLPTALGGLSADCCKMTYTICLRIRVYYDKERCNSCTFTYCFPAFSN